MTARVQIPRCLPCESIAGRCSQTAGSPPAGEQISHCRPCPCFSLCNLHTHGFCPNRSTVAPSRDVLFARQAQKLIWRILAAPSCHLAEGYIFRNGHYQSGYESRMCSSLPGLNRTARPGAIDTSVPVRGFLPIPVFRGRTLNTPKPRSSIRCPSASACFRLSKTVSTACSALFRGSPVRSITR